jgi:hypothetical protein
MKVAKIRKQFEDLHTVERITPSGNQERSQFVNPATGRQ